MRNISFGIVILSLLLCTATSSPAQVNIGIGINTPGVSIGINLGDFPELVPVPGYPVYYAPRVAGNYFFYDGLYWAFIEDHWYASDWYDGPWWAVRPEYVPVYILRIPVRYYRYPPPYFKGWRAEAPPRWGRHWGPQWEKQRRGWDKWDRRQVPKRAPLPVYQREYREDRYPRHIEQQQDLRRRHYRYEPRDKKVRQLQSPERTAPVRRDKRDEPRIQGPERHVGPDSRRPGETQQPSTERRDREMRQQKEQPRDRQYDRRESRPQEREQRYEKREKHQERQESKGREERREDDRGPGR